jgi:PAS domain S-box-containing protein
LRKTFFHRITKRIWPGATDQERKKPGEILFSLAVILILAIIHLVYHLFSGNEDFCILSNAGFILAGFIAVACLIYRKTNCVLNASFSIPLLVYFCYISGLSVHTEISNTIYRSVGYLLAGALFLFLFSESKLKIVLYSVLSALTIGFQLVRGNSFIAWSDELNFAAAYPLIAFLLLITGGFLLRTKYDILTAQLKETLDSTIGGISAIIRESAFPIAEIKANRDGAGNVINLKITRVNHAFESTFKIHLHEVKEQDANYIFGLVLNEPFDLNRFLFPKDFKTKEFHARKLELWFNIHILKPGYGSYYILFENITRIKNKMAELENSKKRYKVLLEAIPDMFFVIDKNGTYEDFVIKESDLFKLKEVDIVGSTIFDVGFPVNMAEKILHCIHSCLKYNSLETIEYSMNTPNGTYLFEMRLAKLDSRSVISVSRDITRRKNAEFDLEKAKIKAEESDRLKSAFLANLSHEIRTPLNIITNFTRMLADLNPDSSERTELSNAILQNSTQLLNMIDNTIHLSKIETNGVDIKMDFCPINPLIRDIYIKYKTLISDEQQVKMMMKCDVPNASFGFVTDRRLLTETLQILADNAVKYTMEGEISLGYEMQGANAVKFIVSDTGIGIPTGEQTFIFSRFYRVKNSINEVTSGSGIGLPIAQHYVRLLGGELQLESTPGKGSIFSFTIPFTNGEGFLKVVN